jgi:hypothetical protein
MAMPWEGKDDFLNRMRGYMYGPRGGDNGTNQARAAGMPMQANQMHAVLGRGSNNGSLNGVQMPQMNQTAPVQPPPMGFFPRVLRGAMSAMDRFGELSARGSPGFDTALGLLAAGGPSPVPVNMGQAMLGAADFASQRQADRLREEAIQREFDEIERQRQASAQIAQFIRQSPDLKPRQAEMLSRTAELDPMGAMDLLSQMPGFLGPAASPELSETGEKLRDIRDFIGRDLTEREALTIAGAGQMFEATENEQDKPLSTTDLARIRQPDGSAFPPGTTAREAQEAGAKFYSESELEQRRKISTALNTLDTLETMAVGDDGVFVDNGGSLLTNNVLSRLGNGIANGMGSLLGTEQSVRREIFNDTARGSISSLVRSMGEAGSLSDGDVARALALIPELGGTPDTEAKARAKLSELRKIISQGIERLGDSRADSREGPVEIGGGVTLEFID